MGADAPNILIGQCLTLASGELACPSRQRSTFLSSSRLLRDSVGVRQPAAARTTMFQQSNWVAAPYDEEHHHLSRFLVFCAFLILRFSTSRAMANPSGFAQTREKEDAAAPHSDLFSVTVVDVWVRFAFQLGIQYRLDRLRRLARRLQLALANQVH